MGALVDLVREEVEKYAGHSINAKLYPIFDEKQQLYMVLSVGLDSNHQPARSVVMARIVGEYVVIEADTTDKPLIDALMAKNISRSQIVLAYAGEKIPDGYLKKVLYEVVSGYAGEAMNGYSYLTASSTQDFFTVVSIGNIRGKHIVDVGIIVRIAGDSIVIERDVNDKPLVDALIQSGIPRSQIILAYAGEVKPDEAKNAS